MESAHKVKTVNSEALFLSVLPAKTKKAFISCTKIDLFKGHDWYLAGGTALALQEGHRQSVDLDFFTTKTKINEIALERKLFSTGKWQTNLLEKGTLYGIFDGAKMSLISYPFFLPSKENIQCGNIKILLSRDIATMKIIAISQRGKKRDFVDLFWYCTKREKLFEVVKRATRQYPGQEHNLPHILKSLTFFDDAENDPMPKLFFKADWKEIKRFFQNEVKKLARTLLHLT